MYISAWLSVVGGAAAADLVSCFAKQRVFCLNMSLYKASAQALAQFTYKNISERLWIMCARVMVHCGSCVTSELCDDMALEYIHR